MALGVESAAQAAAPHRTHQPRSCGSTRLSVAQTPSPNSRSRRRSSRRRNKRIRNKPGKLHHKPLEYPNRRPPQRRSLPQSCGPSNNNRAGQIVHLQRPLLHTCIKRQHRRDTSDSRKKALFWISILLSFQWCSPFYSIHQQHPTCTTCVPPSPQLSYLHTTHSSSSCTTTDTKKSRSRSGSCSNTLCSPAPATSPAATFLPAHKDPCRRLASPRLPQHPKQPAQRHFNNVAGHIWPPPNSTTHPPACTIPPFHPVSFHATRYTTLTYNPLLLQHCSISPPISSSILQTTP
jgi:hypothetical protein